MYITLSKAVTYISFISIIPHSNPERKKYLFLSQIGKLRFTEIFGT